MAWDSSREPRAPEGSPVAAPVEPERRRVFDFMNPDVVCARPGMSVREVARLLADRRVAGAPVVDDDGHILGVVSQNDLARHLAQRERLADAGRFFTNLDEYRDLSEIEVDRSRTPVEKVMRETVYTVARDAGIAIAAHVMRERGVHHLFVTERGLLVGVISALDLLRLVEELMTRGAPAPEEGR